MKRSPFVFLGLSFLTIHCAHKRIVLPDNGDRTLVYTESGDKLIAQNKTLEIKHTTVVANKSYQGDLAFNTNYSGKFQLSDTNENVWLRDGMSNIVWDQNILYCTNNGVIQRYDIKNKKTLASVPIDILRPVTLSIHENFLAAIQDDGVIQVVDINTNKIMLTQTINALITKRALIDQNRLIVQTQADELICFDILTNKELWRYTHSKHHTYLFQNDQYAGLNVWGDYLVFVAANGDVILLNKYTQEAFWVYPCTSTSELMLNAPFTPIIDNDRLYLAKKDTGLICLDLRNRQLLWNRPSIQTTLAPCVYNGYIFVVADKKLIAVDAQTGQALYIQKLKEKALSSPFIQDGSLVIHCPSSIHRINPQTGQIQESLKTPSMLKQILPFEKKIGTIWNNMFVAQ